MSPLEQQLKELQTKKHKIAYFQEAIQSLDLLGKPNEGDTERTDARLQVVQELIDVIHSKIAEIESGQNTVVSGPIGTFTQEEVEILKTLAGRALERQPQYENVETNSVVMAIPKKRSVSPNNGAFADDDDQEEPQRPQKTQPPRLPPQKRPQDKVSFALANRHLENKRVTVRTRDGQVGGVVTGLDSPNVWVKTDTGHTVPVPLEHLTVE